ncbi:MAG: 50S ribosomal protein L11 [Nanoarchaeota archaeon]
MGNTQTVDALVEGGKASAGPPIGPALGALKVNVGQVVSEINKKTADFKGMQVPVKIVVDLDDKSFTITVGTPPVSALVKKEAGIEKGSGNPLADKVANIYIEQVIKISKMKEDALLGKTYFAKVNEILGTCNSMGVMVEGKPAKDIIVDIRNGAFKQEILSQKTELTAEEMKTIEAEKQRLQQDIEKRKSEFTALAQKIIAEMAGKPRGTIKARLVELKVPAGIIEELLPVEAAAAAPGSAPAGGAPATAKK